MKASLPPHSATIGVRFWAQAAMTFLAVAAEPVKAILFTALRARRSPVWPDAGDQLQHRLLRHDLGKRADEPAADRRGELAGLEHHGVPGRPARRRSSPSRLHRGGSSPASFSFPCASRPCPAGRFWHIVPMYRFDISKRYVMTGRTDQEGSDMSSAQLYDTIGATYSVTRRTEPRIAAQVWAALGDARTVLNVGAGTGSYEPPVVTSPRWNRRRSCARSAPQARRRAWLPLRRAFRSRTSPSTPRWLSPPSTTGRTRSRACARCGAWPAAWWCSRTTAVETDWRRSVLAYS